MGQLNRRGCPDVDATQRTHATQTDLHDLRREGSGLGAQGHNKGCKKRV